MSTLTASETRQTASASFFDLVAEAVESRSKEEMDINRPLEWEVVFPGGLVNVRTRNSIASDVVRTVETGTVVLGQEEGGWVKLYGIDGYIEIRLETKEKVTELLRKRNVAYLISDGNCDEKGAYDIPDPAICKHAALWLDQSEDALWFKDGCQVDLGEDVVVEEEEDLEEQKADEDEVNDVVASEDNMDAVEDDNDQKRGAGAKEIQIKINGKVWEPDADEDDAGEDEQPKLVGQAEEKEALGGRRLTGGEAVAQARRLSIAAESDSAPGVQSGAESWEEYSARKGLKRVCSTAPYVADKLFPVRTHTSVTSVTTTTTQSTATTYSLKQWGSPSLFCFAVFRANTAEQDLVKEACRLNAGIFACDTTVTVSGEKIWVGKDYKHRDVWSWVNQVDEVTMGDISTGQTTNSWLNTQIFINAINMLVNNDIMWDHDWIIKGDPDAVILPDRIRTHIIASGSTGTSSFYENCFNDGKWLLYGSIEIFSRDAMQRYKDAGQEVCEWGMQWQGWGEDMYMAECMHKLGAAAVQSGSLVGDAYCAPRACSDGEPAAFHPFKTKDDWRRCLEAATGMSFPESGDILDDAAEAKDKEDQE